MSQKSYWSGLAVCIAASVYGGWLIVLSFRGDTVDWLSAFGDLRALQSIIGLLMQLPLVGYLFVGFYSGMLG